MQAILLYVLNVYYQCGVKIFFLMIIGKSLAEKVLLKAKQRRESNFLEICL